ncbi:MAG: glycosyltransferase [Gammaproteobacteria bacterium]|nr:glycosyltransferase [Gammaproteobacteria bacterium]
MTKHFHLSRFAPVIVEPERLTHVESWHRHIPFAFAVLEMLKPSVFVELGSHWGDSYCAFCQGVQQQRLATRCYAVDTWQGDEHAGHYGNEVYEDLSAWHNPRYSAFSTLLRMTFDDALAHFPDGSVDLLHIDGLHTYEAVKHDFETWLPKMSSQGVVLFHDTNVRHADFGVWQLWDELSGHHPSFEFPFGFGLGVLAVGPEVPQTVLDFLEYAHANPQLTADFFHRHGDAAQVRKQASEIERLQQRLNSVGIQLSEVRGIAEEREAFIKELQQAWQGTQADLQREQEKLQHIQSELIASQAEQDALVRQQQNTTVQLERSLELLRQYDVERQAVRQFVNGVLRGRWWRVRNLLMRLVGQRHRVVGALPDLQAKACVAAVLPDDRPAVTIIVPVYGGVQDTKDCIESILASCFSVKAELVVINDASPEAELVAWLKANSHRFTLLHNEQNLGFVGTVNRGMALYPEQDVVLVNSDAEVANDWLDRMQHAAYSAADVGSVTPFSNNATICSYPDFCRDNALPDGYDVRRLDALAAKVNAGQYVDIPTAVGFCMYIRRDCLHDAGAFDAELFGRGYGEENEFCMRSARRGWRHLLTGDTFVYHKGGVSFAETQSENQRQGHRVLTSLHPDYDWIIQQHVAADPARPLRFALDAAIADSSGKPVVLMVNHGRGGGSQRHVEELCDRLAGQLHTYLLTAGPDGSVCVGIYDRGQRNSLSFAAEQSELLLETLRLLGVSRIHFHHIIDLPHAVISLPEHLGCRYDISVHDYYFACPQVTLVDEHGRYCGAPDENGCNACLAKRPVAGAETIDAWRMGNGLFLQGAERVFVPSQDVAQRMQRYFPKVNFIRGMHEAAASAAVSGVSPVSISAQEPLRVLVLGALSAFKGADMLERVAMLARQERAPIELHLLGYAYRPLRTWPVTGLRVHGAYQDAQLKDRIYELGAHVVWFPGSCPETWSYTLTAALEEGFPIVAPAIGAFPERLAGRDWTWLVQPDREPAQILTHLLQVREDLVRGRAPDMVEGQGVQSGFDYEASYVEGLCSEQVAGAQDWSSLMPRLFALKQPQSAAVLLAGVRPAWVRKILVIALKKGWLQAVDRHVPYALREKIKRLLMAA